jgi:predicted nucleic acid-binding protein
LRILRYSPVKSFMSDKIFVDTNIFVYAYVANNEIKHNLSSVLLKSDLMGKNVYISTQVIGEFYTALTKLKQTHKQIISYIADFIHSVNITGVSLENVEYCLLLKERYGYSYWDSLILSSAINNGCSVIYSEDMQDGQNIENRLLIQNPLKQ